MIYYICVTLMFIANPDLKHIIVFDLLSVQRIMFVDLIQTTGGSRDLQIVFKKNRSNRSNKSRNH